MGEMAEWVNDDTPWDGLGPDLDERASLERAEAAEAEVTRLRKLCAEAGEALYFWPMCGPANDRLRSALKAAGQEEET